VIIFIQFSPNNSKYNLKESAYVTNNTAKTSIKNHIYCYATQHETAIIDSDGVTGNSI
jgi:hypothetical protein